MQQPDFKAIAAQLRQPQGEAGVTTAQRMSENNANMIRRCIDHMPLQEGDHILEMGPGGGLHLPYLMQQATGLQYTGVDISPTMVALASANNSKTNGNITFISTDITHGMASVPFPDQCFDSIFTVNTLYFWDDAPAQARELLRVLKPGGYLAVCFATETFMQMLPFTQYGFHLYSVEKACDLLDGAGFLQEHIYTEQETVTGNAGEEVQRDFVVMLVKRPA